MPRPFMAIFPKTPTYGDEVIIKGKLKDNAEIFSVNFSIDGCDTPSYIVYHFKTIFPANGNSTVVHNYKSETWGEEINEENSWIDGPGEEFILTFLFNENGIIVYSGDDGGCFQYKFVPVFDISDIKVIQLWDDIEYIKEIVFRYKHD